MSFGYKPVGRFASEADAILRDHKDDPQFDWDYIPFDVNVQGNAGQPIFDRET